MLPQAPSPNAGVTVYRRVWASGWRKAIQSSIWWPASIIKSEKARTPVVIGVGSDWLTNDDRHVLRHFSRYDETGRNSTLLTMTSTAFPGFEGVALPNAQERNAKAAWQTCRRSKLGKR
jgi:hypothetical protein